MWRSCLLITFLIILTSQIHAKTNSSHWVSFGSDAKSKVQERLSLTDKSLPQRNGVTFAKLDQKQMNTLSHLMHKEFNRCGGFFFHETRDEAESFQQNQSDTALAERGVFANYSLTQGEEVRELLPLVKSQNIKSDIEKLSSYHNRYYTSDTGVEAMKWIAKRWRELTSSRSDVSVKLVEHDGWPQPSVILTMRGSNNPHENIVLGGHADSIAGWWNRSEARAPGADDNASGIATLTEVIRIVVEKGYRPNRTIKFMAYAAEEVGLRGSKEIAGNMKDQGQDILGVLQLDMTNYVGSDEWDITLISDYTNQEQNAFLGKLIDTYLPRLKWGYDDCGYACSDHASWHSKGFPVSFPFESKSHKRNPEIHSDDDDLAFLGNNAEHAAKFAKLSMAYLIELDR